MKTSMTRDDYAREIKQISAVSHRRYGSYAYSAGFYESLLADVLYALPETRRAVILKQIHDTVEDLSK